jgi:hypothetical protein
VKRIRLAALALCAAAVLSGCAQSTPGQVAMTTEPMSPDMTCDEYMQLSDKDRLEFTRDLLDGEDSSMGRPVILSAIAMMLCRRTPTTPVKDILVRLGP